MKKFYLLLLILPLFIFAGCELEDDEHEDSNLTSVPGWHFQGRDCLGCHNSDLASDKGLLIAGTMFKTASVTDQDDMSQVCGSELVVNFLDSLGGAVQISSKDYEVATSAGYDGKGNFFMLSRMLDTLNTSYFIQITDSNSTELNASKFAHNFDATAYDKNSPQDMANRLSCNSCHSNSGIANPLSSSLCQ